MTNSITSPTRRKAPLRCPDCGCSHFVEVVYKRSLSRAVFYNREECPTVSARPFEREADEIHVYCDRCNWFVVPAELEDAPGWST